MGVFTYPHGNVACSLSARRGPEQSVLPQAPARSLSLQSQRGSASVVYGSRIGAWAGRGAGSASGNTRDPSVGGEYVFL